MIGCYLGTLEWVTYGLLELLENDLLMEQIHIEQVSVSQSIVANQLVASLAQCTDPRGIGSIEQSSRVDSMLYRICSKCSPRCRLEAHCMSSPTPCLLQTRGVLRVQKSTKVNTCESESILFELSRMLYSLPSVQWVKPQAMQVKTQPGSFCKIQQTDEQVRQLVRQTSCTENITSLAEVRKTLG